MCLTLVTQLGFGVEFFFFVKWNDSGLRQHREVPGVKRLSRSVLRKCVLKAAMSKNFAKISLSLCRHSADFDINHPLTTNLQQTEHRLRFRARSAMGGGEPSATLGRPT